MPSAHNIFDVTEIARVCHEANRALQYLANDEAPSPEWDLAPEWQKESAVVGVQKTLAGATPEHLHLDWCDYKLSEGWIYGEIKDSKKKTHPCLVAYGALPKDQRIKDDVFHAIVQVMSK